MAESTLWTAPAVRTEHLGRVYKIRNRKREEQRTLVALRDVNRRQVLACDTPANLKHRLQRESFFRFEVGPLPAGGAASFEAVAGALYLFSGAIFPLEVLPAWLRPLGYALPVTYWPELLRRALVGPTAHAFPTLAGLSNLQLLDILIVLTVVLGALSIGIFRWCERGLIDRIGNY